MQKNRNGSKTNISVGLTDSELNDLEELIAFFQAKTPATITKTDVITYLLSKTNEARKEGNTAYFSDIGVNMNYTIGKTEK